MTVENEAAAEMERFEHVMRLAKLDALHGKETGDGIRA